MRLLTAYLLFFVALEAMASVDVIERIDWSTVKPLAGEIVDDGGKRALRLEGSAIDTSTFGILELDAEAVSQPIFGIQGEIRYAAVEDGYLEMWVVFGDGGRYFSRTLAEDGPMRRLQGDSAWRTFRLPFSSEGSSLTPASLELNLVLEGAGQVFIGPLELIQAESSSSWPTDGEGADVPPWWTDSQAGWIGGIGGTVIGLLGAVGGLLASRGRARRVVLTSLYVLTFLAGLAAAAGVLALIREQPYSVWYVLLLGGGLGLALGIAGRITLQRAYTQHEMCRMRARDLA